MNKNLHFTLLGSPRLLLDTQPLTGFATLKAQALLYYLVVSGQPHSRDHLASLLWEGMNDAQAKKNLRTVLPDLRRLLGDHLLLERQTVAFQRTSSYWLDVEVIRRTLSSGGVPADMATRQDAVDLYKGEFLSGFYVHNAPAFDAWVLEQREQLHTLVVTALSALVNEHSQRSESAAALATNRRLLLLEPWSEPIHRQQMLLLAQTGERSAALAQYETCCRILADEFGVAPLAETTALYEEIRMGKIGSQGEKATSQPTLVADQPNTIIPASEGASHPQDKQPDADRKPNNDGVITAALPRLQVAGHGLPLRAKLYGRQAELASLHKWLIADGCHLVGIFGIGGQGKSALAAAVVRELLETTPQPIHEGGTTTLSTTSSLPPRGREAAPAFTRIIWHSLINAPPLAEVLQEWFYVLSEQKVTSLPTNLDQQFSQLITYLQYQRCLLILDNLESILQSDEHSGHYRPGYEAFGQLIRRLAEGNHRSCLLLTSRERPQSLTQLAEKTPAVRFLALAGLATAAGRQMLVERGAVGDTVALDALVQHYSGNPLALQLAAETVQDTFDGNLYEFLQIETLVFDDIREVLDQQFFRLTPLERELILWLAIVREPIAYTAWRELLAQPPTPHLLLEAVHSLQRRSLVEKYEEGFGLQNVILEYTTALLLKHICRELLSEDTMPAPALSYVNRYALTLTQTKEYVRVSQIRQLLQPVASHLLAHLGSKGAVQQLQKRLDHLRTMLPSPGYAAANLLHLLLQLNVDLRGYDFSQLYLRQAYLRGISLPQTNFAGAQIIDSVFSEPFSIVYTVAFSPDGQYVAAGTSEGAIYLWHTADQQLVHMIPAHQHAIRHLTFAQQTMGNGERHLVLASASDDKSIGFWVLTEQGQVHQHVHLVHAQQGMLVATGLHPDGQRVTGVDVDGHVFVWDVGDPKAVQLVHHFATAFTRIRLVAFSQDGQTVAIGHRDGIVRLWQTATGEASLRLVGTTGLIFTLALSRDGQFLVTGGRDGHLSLWRLPTGELHQVIETKARAVRSLAFSPDGKFLASGHEDLAIRLWSIDTQGHLHLQRTLLGHTQTIWSVAFGPSPALQSAARRETHQDRNRKPLLVTGSSDHTVRVWDVETGHSLYMLRGQPRVLAAHTIRQLPPTQPDNQSALRQPPEWLLAAAGYDQLIHLWQGQGHTVNGSHFILRGASGPLYAVAISPDGRSVVAGGYDCNIYLWDRASGQLRQTCHGHTNCIYAFAFHPDGKLLASGSGDGTIRLWLLSKVEGGQVRTANTVLSAQPVAVLQADLDVVHDLAFSHDGRILARGGSDRLLRLWDMTQSHYPELTDFRKQVQDESEEDIFAVAFSPDGSKVACSGNRLIRIVDVANGTAPLILQAHSAWIYSVAFSPNGTTLASSGADCTICLWEVATGVLQHILVGHTETVYKVTFAPDGSAVVSSSFDGTLKFWDSQTGECLNTLNVEGPYDGMNVTGITGISEAQKTALKALGAVENVDIP